MPKTAINQYSATPASNTDIDGIDIQDGSMLPSSVNNAIRALMSHLKEVDDGTASLTSPDINGGSITGITDLAIADGGTGASTESGARTNLGLGTIATQAANSVDIDGGAIDGTTIGGSSAAAGTFTYVTASNEIQGSNHLNLSKATLNNIYFADALGFSKSGTGEAMRISSDRYVGIRTTAPGSALQVGDTTANGANYITIGKRVTSSQSNLPVIGHYSIDGGTSSDLAICATSSSGNILFFTGNNAAGFGAGDNDIRMRIKSNGTVGIGHSSPNDSTRCAVKQTSTTSSDSVMDWVKGTNSSSSTNYIIRAWMNGNGTPTGTGSIRCNGASAMAFFAYSDERMKENIVDLPPQLDKIMALRPREFDYKDWPEDDDPHQIGFVAQEFQPIYPDAVAEEEDGMLSIGGWDKTTTRLVKALQEAVQKIEALEARTTALEARITALEAN